MAFDNWKLETHISGLKKPASLKFTKISYGNQDWEKISDVVKELASAFMADASLYQENKSTGWSSMSLAFDKHKHQQQLAAISSLFTVKNPAFSEEKEWRLLLFERIEPIDDVDFRESPNGLSPFVRFPFPSEAIVGVTLGPTNKTPVKVVEKALKANGFDCWVSRSQASYQS